MEKLSILCLACIAAGAAHAAMTLSANGMGQVLLFPYYTVQGGQSTLVTLVNTTDRAKVLDVRFNEAFNGRVVSGGVVFLGPHDTWVGAVFATDTNGAANLVSDDRSCMVFGAGDPVLPDGRTYHPFRSDNYIDGNADRGPAGLNRTREGSIDVVEVAQVTRGSRLEQALTSASGQPDCMATRAPDATTMVDAPGGGVYGTFAIVDAAQGTVMAGQPTVIDGFSVRPILVDDDHPSVLDRASTSTDPADAAVEALVPVGHRFVSVKYAHPIDAVTALLMTDTLYGDFMRDPSAGADTDWVIAAPTKKFYTDNYHGQPGGASADPPYRDRYSGRDRAYSCMPYNVTLYDREQRTVPLTVEAIGVPPPYFRHANTLCLTVDVLRFNAIGGQLPQGEEPILPAAFNAVSPAVESRLSARAALIVDPSAAADRVKAGAAHLSFATAMQPAFLPAGVSGPALRGLPVIGFEATKYVSGSIGGVLANYTYAVPLRGRAACADAQGAAIECP